MAFFSANGGGRSDKIIQSGSSGNLTFGSNHRASLNIAFDKSFSSLPNVVATLTYPNYRDVSLAVGDIAKNRFTAYIIDNGATESTASFEWVAIGDA